jgi:hypothetical protein
MLDKRMSPSDLWKRIGRGFPEEAIFFQNLFPPQNSHFSRVESWRRAGAAFELFDARIYSEL